MNIEGRQTLRRNELHLDFPPFTIPSWISWTVSEHILVAQLYSNLCRHIGKFVRIVDAKEPSAGDFTYLIQQVRTVALFGGRRTVVKDADGINLDVCLLDHGADLTVGIA